MLMTYINTTMLTRCQHDEEERRAWQLDLGERLRDREEQDAKEREEKRRKRNEKRRKGGVKEEDNWEGRLGIIA